MIQSCLGFISSVGGTSAAMWHLLGGNLHGWSSWRTVVAERRQCVPRNHQGLTHDAQLDSRLNILTTSALEESKMTWVPGFNHPPCDLTEARFCCDVKQYTSIAKAKIKKAGLALSFSKDFAIDRTNENLPLDYIESYEGLLPSPCGPFHDFWLSSSPKITQCFGDNGFASFRVLPVACQGRFHARQHFLGGQNAQRSNPIW